MIEVVPMDTLPVRHCTSCNKPGAQEARLGCDLGRHYMSFVLCPLCRAVLMNKLQPPGPRRRKFLKSNRRAVLNYVREHTSMTLEEKEALPNLTDDELDAYYQASQFN